jgi:hypothetical protein
MAGDASTSTTLWRECAPWAIRTLLLGRSKAARKYSIKASFALLSAAGAEIRSFNASPWRPAGPGLDAPGWMCRVSATVLPPAPGLAHGGSVAEVAVRSRSGAAVKKAS